MSKATLTAIAVLLAGAVGGTYLVKPELFGVSLAKSHAVTDAQAPAPDKKKASKKAKKSGSAFEGMSLITATDWADTVAKRDALSAEILAEIGGGSIADAQRFVQDKNNLKLVAQWIVAQAEVEAMAEAEQRTADAEKNLKNLQEQLAKKKAEIPEGCKASGRQKWDIAQLENKIKRAEVAYSTPQTIKDAVASSKAATLMEKIAADPEWIEQFAFTGECVRPGMALDILVRIADNQPDMFTNRMVRDIATATALEYAKSSWNAEDAVERAAFYIKNYKAGRLNSVFDDIPFWERRMVCGCKGDNPYGSIASLEWSLENVHLPADQYPGSCWRCAYRLNNIYGDSIHGPQYYAPWDAAYPENRTALTYYVGGVCGSLSHFGAFSALANGVPAMTAGEPGHCAYIVKVGERWTPAYSLSWDRGLHWQVYRNVHSFSSLHAATEMYGKEQAKDTMISNVLRTAAGAYAQKGDVEGAANCYKAALKAQPRNFMAWREWWTTLGESAPAEAWEEFNDTLCSSLVPVYPELGFEVMQKGALANMAKAVDKKKLRKLALDFWRACDAMGPDRWHIERLANAQLEKLGISAKAPDELCSFYTDILTATSSSAQYMSVMLGWGNNLSSALNEEGKKKFMAAMVKGIQKGKGMSAEDKDKLLGPALLAAEKTRDINTFQAIGAMLSDKYKKPSNVLPKHEPFPGKLASKGGLVWASSTSQWDNACSHWGLLEECGGTFHTAKDTDAYLVVQLPRQVNVTGVVLVTNPGNLHRLHNMKIQVSEDGEKWTDVHQFGPCKQRVMRADLGEKLPLAKYVRILRPGGPEFFHLNAVYVYGNQAA
ncbi:MAG: discoidin domain-containing protein [Akkermansia sp.]|nr:discoidin domain-containing protein [Akkermansia sp.]